jgi:hypothetical protein
MVLMPKINIDVPDDLAEQIRAQNLSVSAICQRALRAEISHLQMIEQAVGIIIQVGEPAVDIGFRGRWLVEPDIENSRAGPEEGAYWGVALTKRGRIAVYRAHVDGEWAASLSDYDTFDKAMAKKALSDADVMWRDI